MDKCDKPPFEMTDNGIAATAGRLNNHEASRLDSARQANGLGPVPPDLRAKAVGRGAKKAPPPTANGKGPGRF